MKNIIQLLFTTILLIPVISFGQVNYTSSIQPILDAKCVGCHGPGSGIDLRNYTAVMNSVSPQYSANLVIPNDANESPLYDKVRIDKSPRFGSRMPQGSPLPQEEIDLIRNWINEGAQENANTSNEEQYQVYEYGLQPNFPNPFNPSTNIRFTSQSTGRYELSIYNTLGQKVLFKEGVANGGLNVVGISLIEQSSGLYFYNLRIFDGALQVYTSTSQLTLLK